ncbi:hypothetical protein [Pseudomonas sp. NA-150]|uniref:hypothetical protein n=1 Tax=Pseudomonas sp. NA-150 TaxID=3367525 RepID=UPI0037C82E51
MNVSPIKILLIVGTLFLSACSGVSTGSGSYSSLDNQQYGPATTTKANFNSGLGSSFNQYGLGLMEHD